MSAHIIPFQFDTQEVRTLLIDEQPWFFAMDVCAALDLRDTNKALIGLDDDEKRKHEQYSGSGRKPILINESGLYSLILRSRKTEARRFKKWVTAEVLPAIRKYGYYDISSTTIGTDGLHILHELIGKKLKRLPSAQQRQARSQLWGLVHTRFNVPRAELIPADELNNACNFIAACAPLPAIPTANPLDSSDCTNLYALCHHMQALRQLDRQYHLYEALSQLGSPAGKAMYSHMVDGAAIAGRYLERLQQQVH